MKYLISLLVIMFVNLTACSSNKEVGVFYHSSFNFNQVKHYAMHQRNSEFSDLQNVSDITRNGIEIAVEREMDNKGFVYSELAQADLIINYHLFNHDALSFSAYNKSVRYCEHCLIANNWQKQPQPQRLTPGSLILDLVDPKTKRSVWRSFSQLNIKIKDNSQKVNEKVQQAIKAMLAKYPSVLKSSQKDEAR